MQVRRHEQRYHAPELLLFRVAELLALPGQVPESFLQDFQELFVYNGGGSASLGMCMDSKDDCGANKYSGAVLLCQILTPRL